MLDFVRKFIKGWFRNFLVILTLGYFYPGFETGDKLSTLILAGLILNVIQIFFQPLLKMLWLPINVVTLGMFSWFLNVIHLLIVSYLLKSVNFISFNYESFKFLGINVNGGEANIFISILVGGIFYTFLNKILEFLTK